MNPTLSLLTEAAAATLRLGTLLSIDEAGRPWVRFDGGPKTGRDALLLAGALDRRPEPGDRLLLAFPDGSDARPIVLGRVAETVGRPEAEAVDAAATDPPRSIGVRMPHRPDALVVDGRRVTIEAEQEIVLRCGRSSLQLARDGKVVLRGVEVLTRASGTQRIRGSSVQIN